MWRSVDLVNWTDVSVERITTIFWVEKSASQEPAWAGGCRSTRRHIPEDGILRSHRCDNLKSYKFILSWVYGELKSDMFYSVSVLLGYTETLKWIFNYIKFLFYVCINTEQRSLDIGSFCRQFWLLANLSNIT
jgi:hypothetical protein